LNFFFIYSKVFLIAEINLKTTDWTSLVLSGNPPRFGVFWRGRGLWRL